MQHVAAEECNKLQSPLLGCTGSSTEASSFAEETSSAASSSAEGASQRKGCWQRVCCTCGASSSSNSTSSAVSRNTSTLRRRRRGVGMLCCLSQQQQQQQQPSRMLDRNAPFQQCRGEYNITHTHAHLHGCTRARLYFNDWFHSLLYSPTYRVFFLLFLSYTTTVICFGFLYYTVSNVGSRYNLIAWLSGEQNHDGFCNMDINNIMEAIYFSLSTMTTIGYGVSDYYFGDCWAPFLLVLLQVFCAITFDAIAIGVIFMRISRGRKRSRTVVFSSTALLRRVRGDLYVFWRVGDLVKRHQLVDCSVKVYCVKHERELLHGSYEAQVGNGTGNGSTIDNSTGNNAGEAPPAYEHASTPPPTTTPNNHLVETAYYQTYPMSMHRPQTDTEVLLALPSFVVHKIDASSPLMPPKRWVDEGGRVHVWDGWTVEGGGVQEGQEREQQQLEGQGQGQQQEMAPQPTQSTTTNTTIPSTTSTNTNTTNNSTPYQIQQDQITTYLTDRQAEIIVLVEGIDEMTSSIVQARHSYHALDLCWNATFENCVFSKREYERRRRLELEREREVGGWWCRWRRRWKGVGVSGFGSGNVYGNISENVYGGGCVVDFSKFHEFIEAPVDCDACPYIS